MARFCGQCGAPANDGTVFCGACGARLQPAPPQASVESTVVSVAPPPQPPPTYTAVPVQAYSPGPVQKSSSPFLKIILVLFVVLFVGGALALAGIYYAYHRVSEKAHEYQRKVLGDSSSNLGTLSSLLSGGSTSNSGDDHGFQGDPCRFLSKEEVSHAIGAQVIRAQSDGASCQYIVHGDPANLTSKHLSAMMGANTPASREQLQMMQKMAGTFFKQQEALDKDLSAQAATGEVTVLTVSFSEGSHAETEMRLSERVLGRLGPPSSGGRSGSGDIAGIGDEAFESGGTMLMMRKGSTLARFLYPSCPCSTNAIKPLAGKLASEL